MLPENGSELNNSMCECAMQPASLGQCIDAIGACEIVNRNRSSCGRVVAGHRCQIEMHTTDTTEMIFFYRLIAVLWNKNRQKTMARFHPFYTISRDLMSEHFSEKRKKLEIRLHADLPMEILRRLVAIQIEKLRAELIVLSQFANRDERRETN